MVRKLDIDEDLQHPAWALLPPDTVLPAGLHVSDFRRLQQWTLQLSYQREGSTELGSGFFINIPNASHDVILTAAYNLVTPSGSRSVNILVGTAMIPVPASSIRVSADYHRAPTPQADFGAILLPYGTMKGSGFSFDLRLAYEEHIRGDLWISRYISPQLPSRMGKPSTSHGPFIGCYDKQMEYRIEIEQGGSGSPVWIERNGQPTVVAIHNFRPVHPRAGHRGSRITLSLLREVFEWCGVGEYGVKLRRKGQVAVSSLLRGLYLDFSDQFAPAQARLGDGTKFDVLQVRTTSKKPVYAMMHGTRWVFFDCKKSEVRLTDKLEEQCLFQKLSVRESEKSFKIIVGSGSQTYQLKMTTDTYQISKVFMAKCGEYSKLLFTEFLLEYV